jgi:hypothetical protein
MLPALLACYARLGIGGGSTEGPGESGSAGPGGSGPDGPGESIAGEPEGSCPAVDPLNYTVILPNPEDCSSFIMCSNGVPILQKCLDGLYFNPKLDVCD